MSETWQKHSDRAADRQNGVNQGVATLASASNNASFVGAVAFSGAVASLNANLTDGAFRGGVLDEGL